MIGPELPVKEESLSLSSISRSQIFVSLVVSKSFLPVSLGSNFDHRKCQTSTVCLFLLNRYSAFPDLRQEGNSQVGGDVFNHSPDGCPSLTSSVQESLSKHASTERTNPRVCKINGGEFLSSALRQGLHPLCICSIKHGKAIKSALVNVPFSGAG